MAESIKFGDIFKHREKDYVFLAKTDETLYAAEILDIEQTTKVERLNNFRARGPDAGRYKNNPLFCYVILSTEEFKNRGAHFGVPTPDGVIIDKTGFILNKEDMRALQRDISDPASPVANELKQLVKDLAIPYPSP